MTISIIGGSGFLGTSLSRHLQKDKINHKVYDINLRSDSHIYADVTDLKSLSVLRDSNILINLAAVHRDDIRPISKYDEVNVGGAEKICDTARKFNINKIIFTSSVAIYGFAPKNTKEDGEPNYFNDYGRTKYLAEQVYIKWFNEDAENRTLVILRPTVIFGEGNRGNVYNLLNQIASKKFAMFGKGKNIKSMAYVENVSSFIRYSLSFSQGKHIYNYVDKPDYDMNALVSETRNILFGKRNVGLRFPAFLGTCIGYFADILAILFSKNLPISSIRVKKFLSNSQFDTSAFKTGFIPPKSLKKGLSQTLHYEFIEDNSHEQTFETE